MGLPWTLTAVPRRQPVLDKGVIDRIWDKWLTSLVQGLNQQIAPVTYADLPTSPTQGTIVAITDASTSTWGAVIAGGGANKVLAHFNGTSWTVAAK